MKGKNDLLSRQLREMEAQSLFDERKVFTSENFVSLGFSENEFEMVSELWKSKDKKNMRVPIKPFSEFIKQIITLLDKRTKKLEASRKHLKILKSSLEKKASDFEKKKEELERKPQEKKERVIKKVINTKATKTLFQDFNRVIKELEDVRK
jgi:hypothetical protein